MRELSIDAQHNQAIRREIGERLRGLLHEQPEEPGRLRELVRQFGEDSDRALPRLDMVAEGLVKSFARPNGNITGISIFGAELERMRQDILIEAVPGIRRMAALAETKWFTEEKARALQEAARAKNVELSIYRVTRAEEIVATVDKAQASGATALNVF